MNTADPIVIEKFKNLPKKLQDVLFSEEITDTIFSIGKENKLTVFQMEGLADEAGLVLLGINAPEDFATKVQTRFALDTERTAKISKAINEKIFNPILGDLKALIKPQATAEAVLATKKEASSLPLTKGEHEGVDKDTPTSRQSDTDRSAPSLPDNRQAGLLRRGNEEISKQTIDILPKKSIEVSKPVEMPKPIEIPKVSPIIPAPVTVKPAPKPIEPIPVLTPKETLPTPPSAPTKDSQIFAKPVADPYREPLGATTQPPQPSTPVKEEFQIAKPRIINWEDILKNKTKEPEAHPEAKIALEKAMSDVATPSPAKISGENLGGQASTPKQYTGGVDPYREPLE